MLRFQRRSNPLIVRRRLGPPIRSSTLLLGCWVSDRDRTRRDYRWPVNPPPETQRQFFFTLFGKMRLRYDGQRCHIHWAGAVRGWSEVYQVVARDKSPVVIRTADQSLMQIHFVSGDRYWILLPSDELNREWFRKTPPQPPRQERVLGPSLISWRTRPRIINNPRGEE
jgi:hypothetical protein